MTSDELKAFMARHNLKSSKLAEALGVTAPAVDHWLLNRRRMPKIAVKFCKVFEQYPQLLPWVASL